VQLADTCCCLDNYKVTYIKRLEIKYIKKEEEEVEIKSVHIPAFAVLGSKPYTVPRGSVKTPASVHSS